MTEIFRRRYLISLSYLLIAVVGLLAWLNIPKEMFPEIYEPTITVSYSWSNASPEAVEQQVSRKVEGAASRLRNVTRIRSVSGENSSSVTIYFEEHTPVEYRVLELQEYLYGLQESFPPGVGPPNISRNVPSELDDPETFLQYTIGGERPARDIYQYADVNIRRELLGFDGLSEIEISGAQDPALTVRFDTDFIERHNISDGAILSAIRDRLEWRGAGYFQQAGGQFSLLIPPQFDSIDDIRNMPVSIPETSRQVQLRDIAQVNVEDHPVTSVQRLNGKPALTINFVREGGSDAIGLAETVRSQMEEIESMLPADMTLLLERDTTVELKENFEALEYQSMFSLLMVFFILLIFIRRLRAPFVILGSIFFSLLMSVTILFFFDYTLNIFTLAGLTVALGMIIDNAVVVFEQINPDLPETREERMMHIRRELPYALVPVLGSTLTTIGIFVPLFLAMEELREFLVPLALSLTLTLVSSVVVALSWIPYSLIWLLPPTKKKREKNLKRKLNIIFNSWMLRVFYLRHRFRRVLYTALILLFGIPLFAIPEPEDWSDTWWPEFTSIYFENRSDIDPWIGGITWKFFDETYFGRSYYYQRNQEAITVSITMPQGTPFEEVDKVARSFEMIAEPYAEAFDFYETNVSASGARPGANLSFLVKDEYMTDPELIYLPYNFYGEAAFLTAQTGNSSVYTRFLDQNQSNGGTISGGFSGGNQSITLTGYSYDDLIYLAEDIARRLLPHPRVEGVELTSRSNLEQYVLTLDNERLIERGLDRQGVMAALQMDINTENSLRGSIEMNGQRMTLIGQNQHETQYEEQLFNRPRVSNGRYFTLADVGQLEREVTMPQIVRDNQAYSRTVGVQFLGPNEMGRNYIESVLEGVPVPIGSDIRFGGGYFSFGSQDQVRNYVLLLFMTILSVWMIVSALLENWRDPFIVILSVPLSLIGIMAGILFHEINFDQGAIAGSLLAVGVVVNNAILLVHEKERTSLKGISGFRSWVNVYRNKMRAVMITSLTTMGGLMPLIWFGTDDSRLWNDLAIVVIWGLGASLTLLMLFMGIWEKDAIKMPDSFYKRRVKGRVTFRGIIRLPGRIWRAMTMENIKRLPGRAWSLMKRLFQKIRRFPGRIWHWIVFRYQKFKRFVDWFRN